MARQSRTSGTRKPKRPRAPKGSQPAIIPADPTDRAWLTRISSRIDANKVLNRYKERPYWLSIPTNGLPPVVDVYPVTMFGTRDRTYYGFLFREHRDFIVAQLNDARKELTEDAIALGGKLLV